MHFRRLFRSCRKANGWIRLLFFGGSFTVVKSANPKGSTRELMHVNTVVDKVLRQINFFAEGGFFPWQELSKITSMVNQLKQRNIVPIGLLAEAYIAELSGK